MPYEIEKNVGDTVIWILRCYAYADYELYMHEDGRHAHIQGLALHKNSKLVQMFHTGIHDLG